MPDVYALTSTGPLHSREQREAVTVRQCRKERFSVTVHRAPIQPLEDGSSRPYPNSSNFLVEICKGTPTMLEFA